MTSALHDTNLFISNENIGELFQQMNKELKSVSTWFKVKKLFISLNKKKWTFFHPTSRKHFMLTKFPELFIDGITRKRETVNNFLGIFIDENVSREPHINTIPSKISKI